MVELLHPATQFHPYRPPDAIPVAEREMPFWFDSLERVGVNPRRMMSRMERARSYARRHPGRTIATIAGVVLLAAWAGAKIAGARSRSSPETDWDRSSDEDE